MQQQTSTSPKSAMRFPGAANVLQRGFQVCHGLQPRNSDKQELTKSDIKLFKKHYGSDPAVLARMWYDMGKTILLETAKTIVPSEVRASNFFPASKQN